MSSQMEQALKLGLKRLINEVTRNGQLSKFETHLQQRKQYDHIERQYIQNQRLRKELGSEYESSDSEEEKENSFNSLSQVELKKVMRKALIQKNFDEHILEPIKEVQAKPEHQMDQFTTTKFFAEDAETTKEINCTVELNIIKEVKETVQDQIQKETNFGLEFLIYELQRIQKIGVERCLQAQYLQ